MTVKEVLVQARQKIDAPEKWTQGAFGRNADGDYLGLCDPSACRWCVAGAVCEVAESSPLEDAAIAVLAELVPKPPPTAMDGSVAHFNDTHTHAEVLALLDRAIASLEDA